MLNTWKLAAVRSALKVFRSKKDPRKVALSYTIHAELDEADLHSPTTVLSNIHSQICELIAEKRAEVVAIVESESRADWLKRRDNLKHLIKG